MSTKAKPEDHDEFLDRVADLKKKMDEEKNTRVANGEEDEDEDETDALLTKAIEMAIADGRGWSPGEKEAYMARICDDEILPPLFASTPEEIEKSGLSEAFSSLLEDSSATCLMLDFKQKGNDSFNFGRKNVAKNIQVGFTDSRLEFFCFVFYLHKDTCRVLFFKFHRILAIEFLSGQEVKDFINFVSIYLPTLLDEENALNKSLSERMKSSKRYPFPLEKYIIHEMF